MLACVALYIWGSFFCMTHAASQPCEFHISAVSYLSGVLSEIGDAVSAGYRMAIHDYNNRNLYDMDYFSSNIESLTANNNAAANDSESRCTFSIDIRDTKTDIKLAIVEIYNISTTYNECVMNHKNESAECGTNLPFIIGPSTSSDCLTTNPLIEAFNLLQFSPSATSTFLTPYSSFYRPIPSDDPQAKALIELCAYFGWQTLGVLYMNNKYGTSLQRAITKYANKRGMNTTSFSYISEDNVTLTDAVEAMHDSRLFIFILIVYDSDVPLLSHLLESKHLMVDYPYYYLAVDAWFTGDDWRWTQYLHIYGGMIGSCPWSPSNLVTNTSDSDMKYPLNVSFAMYSRLVADWQQLNENGFLDITGNQSQPGLFTMYAYDTMLTIFKLMDEYCAQHNISTVEEFWSRAFANDITTQLQEILRRIWFIGLSGNVSYVAETGDRLGGLWSFCNVQSNGEIRPIGFSLATNIELNEGVISWPPSYSSDNKPQTAYILYGSICTATGCGIPSAIYCCISFSIIFTLICIVCLFAYRKRKIIYSSQWILSLSMAFGCLSCYVALMLFGIDETFPFRGFHYDWMLICNLRLFLLNLSFTMIFGPLFTKIYRIKKIFNEAMIQLENYVIQDRKLLLFNALFVALDAIICAILLFLVPLHFSHENGPMINYALTKWGKCSTRSSTYYSIYLVVLLVPKMLFSLYCIILSISVFSTISMMNFNEGLHILITMVISVLLIFVIIGISSIIEINSPISSMFAYSFLCLMFLIICNLCCVVMILPRLLVIWKAKDSEDYIQTHDVERVVRKYMKALRKNLNKIHFHRFSSDTTKTQTQQTQQTFVSPSSSPMPPLAAPKVAAIELTASELAPAAADINNVRVERQITPLPATMKLQLDDATKIANDESVCSDEADENRTQSQNMLKQQP